MKLLLLLPLLLVLAVSVPLAFAQEYSNNAPTIYVVIGHDNNGNGPTMYEDSEGYSIVNGIVFNNGDNSVSNVVIQINFFDDFGSDPLEVVSGNTNLQVIPPNGQSSFIISSTSPNTDISEFVVNVIGFDESVPESILEYTDNTSLSITTNKSIYQSGDTISITGKVENKITGMPVILQIFTGEKEGAINNINMAIGKDGTFSHTMIAQGSMWEKQGDYIFRVTHGSENTETKFTLQVIETPTTIEPESITVSELLCGAGTVFNEVSNSCVLEGSKTFDNVSGEIITLQIEIHELKQDNTSLKLENRQLKQQITTLQNEVEQLKDLLINGLKEIYNWIS